MKIVLQLSISLFCLFCFSGFSQNVKVVKLEKRYGEMDYAPQIEGIFNGAISKEKICSINGLVTRKGIKILTFDIFYCAGPSSGVHIVGNLIPDTICAILQSECLETEILFNNIKAIDEDGGIKNLSPMRLKAVVRKEGKE